MAALPATLLSALLSALPAATLGRLPATPPALTTLRTPSAAGTTLLSAALDGGDGRSLLLLLPRVDHRRSTTLLLAM